MRFPDSFVGFLRTVSDILRDLGEEWRHFGFQTQDKTIYGWSGSFHEAANDLRTIASNLEKLNAEYNTKFTEPKEG